jgi:hypothetical protein
MRAYDVLAVGNVPRRLLVLRYRVFVRVITSRKLLNHSLVGDEDPADRFAPRAMKAHAFTVRDGVP